LDTHINKSFKDKIRIRFDEWYTTYGIKEGNQTQKGNLKAPSISLLIPWIIDSWNEVPSSIVCNSFKHCGKF